MNFDLSNQKFEIYREYIFLAFDAVNKKTIKNYKGPLWRSALLGKKEVDDIERSFLGSQNKNKNKINFGLSFNRSFLSFSKDKESALSFMNKGNDNTVSILF